MTCTVTLKNGESETPVQVEQGTAFGANLPSNPSKTGYTFLGWYNGEDKLTEETVIDADITYTAKFEPNHYSIAFNANGGSGSMQTLENVAYDEKVKLPKCTFTRDGYDFMGWSTSSYRNTADYGDKEVVEGLHSRDGRVKTLYAIWAGKTFEATFVYGYAGKDNETKTGKVGDDIDLPYVSETSRTGYLFDGWYRSAEGGDKVSSYASYTAADQNGVTFYAHWSKAIIVHYEGGEGYLTQHHAWLHFLAGRNLLAQKKYKEAEETLISGLTFPLNYGEEKNYFVNDAPIYSELAKVYEAQGNNETRDKYLKLALTTNGAPTVHSYYECRAFDALGKTAEAKALADELYNIGKNKIDTAEIPEYYGVGSPAYQPFNYDIEKAHLLAGYLLCGFAELAKGNKAEAKKFAEKAEKIDCADFSLYLLKGEING